MFAFKPEPILHVEKQESSTIYKICGPERGARKPGDSPFEVLWFDFRWGNRAIFVIGAFAVTEKGITRVLAGLGRCGASFSG
jgi:hypothetical protein